MNRNLSARVITVLVLALVAAGTAWTDEGKIPLFEPAAITQPGHYIVTRDIVASSGPVFDIQADGVRLNLGGHTLTVTGTSGDVVRITSGATARGFDVFNGTIQGGLNGIGSALPAVRVGLRDLRIVGSNQSAVAIDVLHSLEAVGIIIVDSKFGFDLGGSPDGPSSAALSDIRISGAVETGIIVDDIDMLEARGIIIVDSRTAMDLRNTSGRQSSARIRDIQVGPGEGGIAPGGISCDAVACDIANGQFRVAFDNGLPAVRFNNAAGGAVRDLTIRATSRMGVEPSPFIDLRGSRGIIIDDNVIHGPSESSSGNHGILADAGSADLYIRGNTVTGCGDDGIHVLSSGNSIRSNLVNGNDASGIFIGGTNNLVEGNRVGSNNGDGIYFDNANGPHVYRNNVLRGNTGGAIGGNETNTDAGDNVL